MENSSMLMMPQTPTPPLLSSPRVKPEVCQPFTKSDDNSRDSVTSYTAEESALRQNHVSTVILHGIPIVSLFIDGRERLCLAQISNTLLKDYSYNEIHNRRVALGITCVQCTPVQLEILRRAGAMPISSRRCGMISKREAERLVKSFLEEHMPPKLPDNFAFCVKHPCGWGCKGQFVPSRYNSSRAKCIKCTYCSLFFSPNKFIFHFHRAPDAKYRHPDAANFNSWRRHLNLDYEIQNEDLVHAWEDVKAMFNGGSRKRVLGSMVKSDVDYLSFEKKSKFDVEPPQHPRFPVSCAPPPSGSNHHNPYPFISNTVNHNNMVMPFHAQPNYPMFPRSANTQIKSMHDSPKINVADIWKNRTTSSMYNPFGFWWAKNFGMPGFTHTAKSNFPLEWSFWQNNKEPHPSDTAKTESDNRYSAFKPVGLLGSRVFSEYNRTTTENDKTSPWEPGKEGLNRHCLNAEGFNKDRPSEVFQETGGKPTMELQTEVENESSCGSEQGSDHQFSREQEVERDFDICVDESQESKHPDHIQRNANHGQATYVPPKVVIQAEKTDDSKYLERYEETEKKDFLNLDAKSETVKPAENQAQLELKQPQLECHNQYSTEGVCYEPRPASRDESSRSSASPCECEDSRDSSSHSSILQQPYRCREEPKDIYDMSKEELQRELLRMMSTREPDHN